jgi:site-specific DNA-methyltransferase (adenine-specific)
MISSTGSAVTSIRFQEAVPIERLAISPFNPRHHRDEKRISEIAELMQKHGFDPAYAMKVYREGDQFMVFAGGNRLLAAQLAGLKTVPVYIYEGLERCDIWRLAYQDNEQAGKHCQVSPVDVWCDYARRAEHEGWTQEQIAEWLGVGQSVVSYRIRLSKAKALHPPVSDGLLEEGHCFEIIRIYQTSDILTPWLSTNEAQSELVEEVLSKHRGSSAGVKPTVKAVREAAKRWRALIKAAGDAFASLPKGKWRDEFVELLAANRVRTEAAVNQALSQIVTQKRRQEEQEAVALRAQADEKEREALKLKQEEVRLRFLESQTAKVRLGDARGLIADAPPGFQLLLADPPYGIQFKSNRRVTTSKKQRMSNDSAEAALSLLADVLAGAFPLMAADATCLIFTGWRYEPQFRQIIEQAGFTVKGSLVWVKNNHGSGDLAGSFAPKHERVIHAVKGNPKLTRRTPDVLSGHDQQNSQHPTEKPRDLLRQLIEAVTQPDDTVVDPFCGTGNSLLEAYALGRDFFGIEIEEPWHRVAVEAIHHLAEEQFRRELENR